MDPEAKYGRCQNIGKSKYAAENGWMMLLKK